MPARIDNRVRLNVRITEDLHAWYKKKAEEMGLNVNVVMTLALNAYREQQTVIPQLPMMVEMFRKIQEDDQQKP